MIEDMTLAGLSEGTQKSIRPSRRLIRSRI